METKTYTIDGRTYTVRVCSDSTLRHYGVKGMKWGRRKARPEAMGMSRRSGQTTADSPEAQAARKEARRQKLKRAAKIGAVVAGAALAAYGAKKLHDTVRDKNMQIRMRQANAVCDRIINKHSVSTIGWSTKDAHDYRNIVNKSIDKTMDSYYRKAKEDSFMDAARNVIDDRVKRTNVSRTNVSRTNVSRANVRRASW